MRILLAEDEKALNRVITRRLGWEGYSVDPCFDGQEALDYLAAVEYDAVVLDVMMPKVDGFEVLTQLRERGDDTPVLFLTAKSAESDRISAYRSGGDDFLSKPFSQAELLAKVSSLLRRYKEYRGKPATVLTIDNLEVDFAAHSVKSNGKPVVLTDTEYAILEYLLQKRGTIVTAPELYEAVWGAKFLSGSGNTVMVHVLNVRRKIEENPSSPRILRTVWGRGYQID